MDVSATLASAAERFKSTTVDKQTPLQCDLGYLAAYDAAPIDEKTLRQDSLSLSLSPLSPLS